MTESQPFELSRRRVLGALGTVGVASAGAGLGTGAYFSDAETFEGNALVAGSLDLKMDWAEHYYGAGEYGTGLDYRPVVDLSEIPSETLASEWRAFPTPDQPLVYVHENDVSEFMDATAIEAYPDVNDDGVQDQFDFDYANYPSVGPACEDGADTPDDMDPTQDGALRSLNGDTYDAEADAARPLIHFEDVKPGDFGEVTFSLHLCDNPGYVWFTGDLVDNDENSVTEPEAEDPDEDQTADDPADSHDGELADALRVMFWYDEAPGNNVYEPDDQGEEAFLGQGDGVHTAPVSLSEAMTHLDDGHGVPLDGAVLDNFASQPDGMTFDELEQAATVDARNCFVAENSYYVGFAWWLPKDHANELQTDSVGLDLGFYVEQCRHNDGGGMAPQSTGTTTPDE